MMQTFVSPHETRRPLPFTDVELYADAIQVPSAALHARQAWPDPEGDMPSAFAQMAPLRRDDRFHPTQNPADLVRAFHPTTTAALALDLSAVTSVFYAGMLQTCAEFSGVESIDQISRRFFYRLGQMKARATRDDKSDSFEFHGDVRDVVTLVISAIYNASPEYRFSVRIFSPTHAVLDLHGTDRYLRAARMLDLARHLTWPTLHPFLEGVADALDIAASVESSILATGPEDSLHTRYTIDLLG